ncbi:hypothetical protein K488DRAFT_75071 [Vararia minispora EC-137]|uniref:Uncharacterized protein n=1 Tax=Vararia minispora EC-137 TaxID=1314806 RepID=A0ACB8Q597_9AGAM|nr:hypothetical protein K488DRAFT_75071 [Vararia minispora EC-137]
MYTASKQVGIEGYPADYHQQKRILKGKLQHARGRIGAKFLKASRKTSKCRARTTACGRKSIDVIALTVIRTEDEIMDRVVGHGMVGGGRTIADAERGSGAAGECGDSEGKGAEGKAGGRESGTGSVCDRGTGKSVKDADARRQERTSNDIIVLSEPPPPTGVEQPRLHLRFHYHHDCDETGRYAVGLEIVTKWMLWEWNESVRHKCFTEVLIKQAVPRTANARPLATPACDDRHSDSRFAIDAVYPRANFCLCIVDGNKTISYFDLASVCPPFSALNELSLCSTVRLSMVGDIGADAQFGRGVAGGNNMVGNGEEVDRRECRSTGGDRADSNDCMPALYIALYVVLYHAHSSHPTPRSELASLHPQSPETRCCSHGRVCQTKRSGGEGIGLKICNDEGGRGTQEGESGTGDELLKRVIWEEVVVTMRSAALTRATEVVGRGMTDIQAEADQRGDKEHPQIEKTAHRNRSNMQSSYKQDQDRLSRSPRISMMTLSRTCCTTTVPLSPQQASDNVELGRACKRASCEDRKRSAYAVVVRWLMRKLLGESCFESDWKGRKRRLRGADRVRLVAYDILSYFCINPSATPDPTQP